MTNHKEQAERLTIEELRPYHNEYNKKITSKIKKSSYNKRYNLKNKKTTETTNQNNKQELNIFK